MHILLGDFTGHGLPAAVGAMPLAEVFYGMTAKGYGLAQILREMNAKLKRILRSEEHTSELQSLMRISYAVFCLKKKTNTKQLTKQHTFTIQIQIPYMLRNSEKHKILHESRDKHRE